MKRLLPLFIFILLSSCENSVNDGKPVIIVSIPPQRYFAENITGDYADVYTLIKPGFSPHNFDILPDQLAVLSSAEVYFTIGLEFEETLINKIKDVVPDLIIYKTDKSISKRKTDHPFIENNNHNHGNSDPHIWLNPNLAKVISQNMLKGLIDTYPAETERFKNNFNSFEGRLDSLNSVIDSIFSKSDVREFISFHPAWGYFADEYGLKQIPVEVEGKEPTFNTINKVKTLAEQKGIRKIFVDELSNKKAAEIIAESINGKSVVLNPLSYNYFENLLYSAKVFSEK